MNPAVQNSHGAVEAALKCPEGHPVQVMAPVPSRVSVVEPAGQAAHTAVEVALCCPEGQAVHVVADPAAKVSVIEPAGQDVHATVEAELCCPAVQAVHVWAPVRARVSVVEPEAHGAQATVDCALYCPTEQTVQLVAPVLSSVFVTEPGPQTRQSSSNVPPTTKLPALHSSVHVISPLAANRPPGQSAVHVKAFAAACATVQLKGVPLWNILLLAVMLDMSQLATATMSVSAVHP